MGILRIQAEVKEIRKNCFRPEFKVLGEGFEVTLAVSESVRKGGLWSDSFPDLIELGTELNQAINKAIDDAIEHHKKVEAAMPNWSDDEKW